MYVAMYLYIYVYMYVYMVIFQVYQMVFCVLVFSRRIVVFVSGLQLCSACVCDEDVG